METITITVRAEINGVEVTAEIDNPTGVEEIKDVLKEQFEVDFEGDETPDIETDNILFEVTDWGDASDYDNLCDIETLCEVCDTKPDNDLEVISAGIEAGIDIDDIDEAYSGKFDSDADFAENICEDCGDVPKDFPHYIYIDWERTAKDIMYDYTEANGHYFRNF